MTAYLHIMETERPRRVTLDGTTLRIGRSPETDLRIDDRSLSREHARLSRDGDCWLIEDLGSRNGTMVNTEFIKKKQALNDGDQILLGKVLFIFHDPEKAVRFKADTKADALREGTLVFRRDDLLSTASEVLTSAAHNILDVISRASAMLIADSGTEQFYERVLSDTCGEVKADRGALLTVEPGGKRLTPRATKTTSNGSALVLSTTITELVLKEKTSVLTRDALRDPRFDAATSVVLQGVRSAMCVPLWHENTVLGVLYADRLLSSQPFTQVDLAIFTILANLTAAKIRNLQLVVEAEARRKLEEEIKLAAEIQRTLLPTENPEIAGYDILGRTYACRTVGGDLFDYVARPCGLGFLVGDVSGKGVSASLLMAALQANLRAFLKIEKDLTLVFKEVNDSLFQSTAANKFATLFYGEIEPRTGRGTYVNAGHDEAILLRATGDIELLESRNMLLGAFPTAQPHKLGSFHLDPGDLLFAYTDGVTEMANEAEEFFGKERLKDFLSKNRNADSAEIRDRLLECLDAFRGAVPPSDDMTFMLIKRHPA